MEKSKGEEFPPLKPREEEVELESQENTESTSNDLFALLVGIPYELIITDKKLTTFIIEDVRGYGAGKKECPHDWRRSKGEVR